MIICKLPGSREVGKPKDWHEELDGECACVHVLDSVDPLSGLNFQYMFLKPSPEEIAALLAGGVLRFGVSGNVLPLMQINVVDSQVVNALDYELKQEIGCIITLEHGK